MTDKCPRCLPTSCKQLEHLIHPPAVYPLSTSPTLPHSVITITHMHTELVDNAPTIPSTMKLSDGFSAGICLIVICCRSCLDGIFTHDYRPWAMINPSLSSHFLCFCFDRTYHCGLRWNLHTLWLSFLFVNSVPAPLVLLAWYVFTNCNLINHAMGTGSRHCMRSILIWNTRRGMLGLEQYVCV